VKQPARDAFSTGRSKAIRDRRLLAIEKILADEYLATKAKLANDPSILEECIEATRRLKTFIERHVVTSDITNRLPSQSHHLEPLEIERYHLKMPMDSQEKDRVEGHLMWCPSCLLQLESMESRDSKLPARKKLER